MATKKPVPSKTVKTVAKASTKSIAVKPIPKKTVATVKQAPAKKVAPAKVAVKSKETKPAKPAASKPASQPVKSIIATKHSGSKTSLPAAQGKTKTGAVPEPKSAGKTQPAKPTTAKVVPAAPPVKTITSKAANPAPKKDMAKKEEVKKTVTPAAVEKSAPAKPAAEVKAKDIKVPSSKPVVLPKMATKTIRKYQPEFTKSVLDKTQRDPGAPSQRYSDSELQEFRELIQRKLEAAKKELSYLHGLITRKDEMGGDEGDNRYMTMEDGSLSMEREQLSQMASRQITFIDHLEKAVMRIENKTYGICRVTGKLIDKARLRAVPHATLSIEAKMGSAK